MKKILYFAIAAAIIGFSQVPAAFALSIGFSANGANSWDVNLYGVNVTDISRIITAYDLDVTYSANTPVSVSFSPYFGSTEVFADPSSPIDYSYTGQTIAYYSLLTPGLIDFYMQPILIDQNGLLAIQNGLLNMTLATLNFSDPTDPGLAFANWYQGPGNAYPNINDIKGFNDEQLYPAVPEPGTMMLFGAGIAGMGAMRRRTGNASRSLRRGSMT